MGLLYKSSQKNKGFQCGGGDFFGGKAFLLKIFYSVWHIVSILVVLCTIFHVLILIFQSVPNFCNIYFLRRLVISDKYIQITDIPRKYKYRGFEHGYKSLHCVIDKSPGS